MITTTCLILEDSDFTRDANLKKEAFAAFITASVVIHGTTVVKGYAGEATSVDPASSSAPRTGIQLTGQDAPAAPISSDVGA